MRERVDEEFKAWEKRQMAYERKCPLCAVCGMHISTDYMYDIDGTTICDEFDCVSGFLRQYRKTVDTWITNREG